MAGNLALPGVDRRALGADPGVAQMLVVPADRFFEPCEVQFLDAARKRDGFADRPGLVGVGAEQEIPASDLAGSACAFDVLLHGVFADLELHAKNTLLAESGDFGLEVTGGDAGVHVTADADHSDLVRIAA